MDEKYKLAIELLKNKYKELDALPKKSDFSIEEVMLIKSKLGPWPRSLETAGLKEKNKPSSAILSRKKRKKSNIRRKMNEK